MRLDAGSELGFLFGKDANDASSNFMMNNCLVVFANNVDAEFLFEEMDESTVVKREGTRHTTMSLVLSSNGSDSAPSGLSLSPLIKVPFELLTSLM